MFVDDDSNWGRAFFARLIAFLGAPPLAYTLLTVLFVPPVPGGAKEELVLISSAISIAFLSIALLISHLPKLRGEKGNAWHFGRIEFGIVGSIWLFLMFLIVTSSWRLLIHYRT